LRLHQLVASDRLSLDDPLARVTHRSVETALGEPDRAARHGEAPVLDRAERDVEPLSFAADQVRGRHPALLEHELPDLRGPEGHLVADRSLAEAREPALHDEGADALRPLRPI